MPLSAGCVHLVYFITSILGVDPAFLDRFDACNYRQTGGMFDGTHFNYRLYRPRTVPTKAALIVWLHGAGEAGTNNSSQLRHIQETIFSASNSKSVDFFILAVQCPNNLPGWTTKDGERDGDMLSVLRHIIQKTVAEHSIDENRILLVGICSGASACWEACSRFPNVFAAASTMNSSAIEIPRLQDANKLSVWAFQSLNDSSTSTPLVRALIQDLRSRGWDATFTGFDTSSHDSWTPAFADCGALEWLLHQRLGQKSIWSTSYYIACCRARNILEQWSWPQILLQIVETCVMILFCTFVFRAVYQFSSSSIKRRSQTLPCLDITGEL